MAEPTTADARSPTPARVLVIDDEPQIRKLLDIALRAQGHGVELADSGQAGLDALAVKGGLHQPAAAEPIVAVGGKQVQTDKGGNDAIEELIAYVVLVVVLEDVLEVVGMAYGERIDAGKGQAHEVAILLGYAPVQAEHVAPQLAEHAPEELPAWARRQRPAG